MADIVNGGAIVLLSAFGLIAVVGAVDQLRPSDDVGSPPFGFDGAVQGPEPAPGEDPDDAPLPGPQRADLLPDRRGPDRGDDDDRDRRDRDKDEDRGKDDHGDGGDEDKDDEKDGADEDKDDEKEDKDEEQDDD